jgi:transposase
MHEIKEVLRLSFDAGLSPRQVAASLSLSRTTVRRYLDRAERAGVGWPLPAGLDETALERALFPPAPPSGSPRPDPDFNWMHKELARKGVTLQLLWIEYKAEHPDGYQYSQFCLRYRRWQRHLDLVLRQDHRAGEKCFIDFSGQTLPIVDADTGAVSQAELFVAVLGASNYTYAEATASQQLADWIGAHTRAFAFFDAVPAICVPDNLRSGVGRAHRYEPTINRSYLEMARHYGTAIIPARPDKPRDKAKVEVGVQIAERWILASLRNLTFHSIAEANAAIRVRLRWLNDRPFSKLDGTRRSLFTQIDRPAMRPLPALGYEYAVYKRAKVNIDYHLLTELRGTFSQVNDGVSFTQIAT